MAPAETRGSVPAKKGEASDLGLSKLSLKDNKNTSTSALTTIPDVPDVSDSKGKGRAQDHDDDPEDGPEPEGNDARSDSSDDDVPYTRVGKPDPFKGEVKDIDRFVMLCEMIFELQPGNYPTQRRQVLYAASHFKGSALDWFTALWTAKHTALNDWDMFVTGIRNTFADIPDLERAKAEFVALKQTGTVVSFVEKFESLCARLGMSANTTAKEMHFRERLQNNIKDALSTSLEEITGYNNVKRAALRYDANIRSRAVEKGKHQPSSGNNNNSSSSSTPKNKDKKRKDKKRGPLSDQEKKRRRDNNLCLYCGDAGHKADGCPKKPGKVAATSGAPLPSNLLAATAGSRSGKDQPEGVSLNNL